MRTVRHAVLTALTVITRNCNGFRRGKRVIDPVSAYRAFWGVSQ